MFKKEFKKSIRYKFLSVMSGILFLSTTVLSVAVAINEKAMLKDSLMTRGTSLATFIAKLGKEPLVMKDSVQLDSIVNDANKVEDIIYTIICDAQDNILTSQFASINYRDRILTPILSALSKDSEVKDIINAIKKNEPVVEISAPIIIDITTIGSVTIGMSAQKVEHQIVKTILFILALNLIVLVVLGVVLFAASKRIIFHPVAELAYAASRLAKGDLTTQVSIKTTGEVRMLVDSFNQMAEDLKETTVSKEYVDNIIKSMIDALLVLSPEGEIKRCNDGACKLLGYDQNELIGQSIHSILPYEESNSNGSNVETMCLTKDGRTIPILLSVSAIRNADNSIEDVVYVAQDITEQKQAERDIMEAKRVAENANRMKSEFVANMSHEIRTPMGGILGMAELLSETDLTERQRRYTEVIHRSGKALLGVINDILDFSKIEAGKLKIIEENFDLRETLEDLIELFAEQAHKKGLNLACLVPPDMDTRLCSDAFRLRQVLANLIGNAIKFTEYGEVAVRVLCARETDAEMALKFEISDTGIGISKEVQASIFDSFTQVDSSPSRRYGGTGLGLSISKQIIELMKGQIGMESEPGKGSTFWFTLPVKKQAAQETAEKVMEMNFRGLRVLIVDGSIINRTILSEQLKAWKIDCHTAENSRQAIELLHDAALTGKPYDLAVLDMDMAGMSALELADSIKTDKAVAAVRLILLVSLGEFVETEKTLRAGIAGYLNKPIRQSDLYNCILAAAMGQNGETISARYKSRSAAMERPLFDCKVLLVEDNKVNQTVATEMLESLGCTVEAAENGLKAIELISLSSYDLVFMDCQMPAMDGFEATKTVRERERMQRSEIAEHNREPSHTTIIAMTAHAMEGDREKCIEAGMDDYVEKPYNLDKLLSVMKRWLPENSDNKPIDQTKLENIRALQREGKPDLLGKVINIYLNDTPMFLKLIRDAIGKGDADTMYKTAHSLKSSSGNLGATAMAAMSRELELLGRGNVMGNTEKLLLKIEEEYERVRAALVAEVRKKQNVNN